MVVVTCVGFHGTGSGAVDDFFREFSCFSQGGYEKECRLLQDPDGVSDLEYNLVENPHRLNSGFALKRFRIMMKQYSRVYRNIFGSNYMKYIDEYIDELTDIKYKGYWFGDIWLEPNINRYIYWAKRAVHKVLPKRFQTRLCYNYFPKIDTYHTCLTEDEFLKATRKFMNRLCSKLIVDGKQYVMLDQLVHPNNLERYMRYVENLFVVIVDRDPRDVYIEQRNVNEHTLPVDPVEFCKVYKDTRRMYSEVNNDCVLSIHFEDMIYKYDEYSKIVMDFVGVTEDQHLYPKTRFNPSKSIKNTQLWKHYPQYVDAVKIIEEQLPEYLYNYEK